MKQKTLRVFEVEDFEKLKNIIESKYDLIKNYYFMLKEKNEKIQNYLKEKELNFFVLNSNENFSTKEVIKIVEKEIEKEVIKEITKDLKIFDKVIRSGEEIKTTSAVFLQKINPGAKVKIKGAAFLLTENRGDVEVEGNFLFVKKNRGNIVYNSEIIGRVDKDTVFYKDKRLEL